ncbi:hypothetical protein [Streptomyces sp. NPDC048340]|uniref:hypothetical protein n=1 Tax=Streptomyces sp. NPDC048340 TaxID=3365537 RepID=UPI003713AFFD
MNELPATVRLPADWAVVGKHPGRTMGYKVLAGSLPPERAERYYWGAATGTPDDLEPAEGLPWRVFLGSAQGELQSAGVLVETTWDGSYDGTGAPSYTWRMLVLDWNSASTARLTWSALDRAAPRERPDPGGGALSIEASPTAAAELADTVDRLGFTWAAGVAALLLEGRQVAIVPPPGARLPDTGERVRILDAVCSLLPYGCRAWLSAATWTGQSEHKLLLVFAPTARTEQTATWLGAGSPPEPHTAAARDYLNELLRIRAKRGSTDDLVAHLLRATEVVAGQDPGAAVRALREVDLVDSVLADVAQGRGNLHEVLRMLDMHPMSTLGDHRPALIVPFLAGHGARDALLRWWSPLTPALLAADVLERPATKESFALARSYLSVLNDLEADRPGAFEELFTTMVEAPAQKPDWVAALIHMTANEFRYTADAVDRVVIGSREVGRSWLRKLVMDRLRDPLPPLTRLVPPALRERATVGPPGWLRFAGVLTGYLDASDVEPSDVAEFTDAGDDAWSIALDIAGRNGIQAVVSLMWPSLRARASRSPQRLLTALEAVASPARAGLTPEAAADADLLGALALATAQGHQTALAMPRLARFTDPGDQEAYASALARRIDTDPDLKAPAIGALLGEEPDDASWAVVQRVVKRLPSAEEYVLVGLERRLCRAHGAGAWIDVLSEDQVSILSRRQQLSWLRRVWQLRNAIRSPQALPEMAEVLAETRVDLSLSVQFQHELVACLYTWGAGAAYDLAAELDARSPGLGLALYQALRGSDQARDLCEELKRYSYAQMEYHRQILLAMGAASGGSAPPPPPPARTPAPVLRQEFPPYQPVVQPAPQKGRLRSWSPWRRP